MADNQKITQALAILTAAYPNNKITGETIRVYQITLQDIPGDVLEKAILHLTTTNKFFPTIAEIRDAAYLIMVGTNKIPSAYEAWGEVQNEIARCGDYFRYTIQTNTPAYSHPLIELAVKKLGYKQLCYSDNLVADRAHFFKVYESLYQRAVDDLKMLPEVRNFQEHYQIEGQVKLLAQKLSKTAY
jgi:hypothetical protein